MKAGGVISAAAVSAFFGLLAVCDAFPSGATNEACNSFRPWHTDNNKIPYRAQNEDHLGREDVNCPYSITASDDFVPGQSITCKYELERCHPFSQLIIENLVQTGYYLARFPGVY